MEKKAIVITNGCPENRIDCAETEQYLNHSGWTITAKINNADLIVLNLCGLLNEIETSSLNLIKQANKQKKIGAKIIVTGCLPKINYLILKDNFSGDIVAGHNIKKLLKLLDVKELPNKISSNYLIPNNELTESTLNTIHRKIKHGVSPYLILNRLHFKEYRKQWVKCDIVQPNTFYIKVCSGCVNACSYCAVKRSRGTVKSKSIHTIKSELLRGLKVGFTQFALVGTDLGSYGKDIHTDLPSLLKELVAIKGKFNIMLRNVHPQTIIRQLPDIIEIVKSGKISLITTAVQHGNNRILKLMNRFYKIEDCIRAINELKKHSNNNLHIRSQLIVGFPSETKEDFNDTLGLIGNIDADFFEIYPYSSRIGTSAEKMKKQNSFRTIQKRHFIATKCLLSFLKDKYFCEEKIDSKFFPNHAPEKFASNT